MRAGTFTLALNIVIRTERKFYLVGGLPRSGSTLLMNILGQNPRFHVTPTSGLASLLFAIRRTWKQSEALKAIPHASQEMLQTNVMRGIVAGWFSHVEQPVCFDKFHFWPEHLETMAALLGGRENVRLLVTVRDLRDVIASFEKLHRETTALGMTHQEEAHGLQFRTALGRISIFIDDAQPVGHAFNAIRDAVTRGWRDCMHFVEYERLVHKPGESMEEIYRFLGEDSYTHDFNNVRQVTMENDSIYGFKDLHNIRPRVEPVLAQWSRVFDPVVFQEPVWKDIEKVAQFWKSYTSSDGMAGITGGLPKGHRSSKDNSTHSVLPQKSSIPPD